LQARPFRIAITGSTLNDLKARLALAQWPDQIEGAGWDYGVDTDYLRRTSGLKRRLNVFDHFIAEMDGIDVRFIHAKGQGTRVGAPC
jgi:hypothetical protein